MNKERICLITNDVETTSIVNGGLRDETGVKVWKEGLPMLLDLYDKYGVKATFFYIANFAKQHPEIIKIVQQRGHEIACHGLTHRHDKAFDVMSYEEQLEHLTTAKKILEDIAGEEVVSFRAPALRVNFDTPKALIEAGFKYDSSVAPQRMDMFMSLGSKNKLQWFRAPRTPYWADAANLARKGYSPITEVPVSSFVVPYIGTFMRISPSFNSLTRRLLWLETKNTSKPINFLIHPNEVITEEDLHTKTQRRASSYIGYLLSDVLRRKLKQKNLGKDALNLFEKEILFWSAKQYEFRRIKDIKVESSLS
jgi:peptidoglycan/xylan/chitin deacetylase (PgdA/CDA1 family)